MEIQSVEERELIIRRHQAKAQSIEEDLKAVRSKLPVAQRRCETAAAAAAPAAAQPAGLGRVAAGGNRKVSA